MASLFFFLQNDAFQLESRVSMSTFVKRENRKEREMENEKKHKERERETMSKNKGKKEK